MSRVPVEKHISKDKTKNKPYYVYMNMGRDPKTNKIKHRYKSYTTLTEARKARDIHLGEIAKNALPTPTNDTVGSYMSYWLEHIAKTNLADSTCYGYKNIITNHLIPYFGNKKIQDLSTKDINEYLSYMNKYSTLSPNTIRKHRELLNNICETAIKENVITYNPVKNSISIKAKNYEPIIYSIEETKILLDRSKGDRIEIIIALAVYLGLRRGEICGLRWSNIDFETKIARIRETVIQIAGKTIIKEPKTKGSKRDVTLSDGLIVKLKEAQERQKENKKRYGKNYNNNDFVVCWDNGKPYRPNYVSELFTKFIKDNSLKQITLHNLRHTFVSIAINAGVDIVQVSRMVGHSKVSTTMDIYAHLLNKNDPTVTDAVADAIRVS